MRTIPYVLAFIWITIHLPTTYGASHNKKLHPEHSLLAPLPNDLDMWFLGPRAIYVDGALKLLDFGSGMAESVWNGIPVNYCNWEVNIVFEIQAIGIPADGFALFYAKDPITRASSNRYINALGGPHNFYGLGLFVDTYNNFYPKDKDFPKVYPVLLHGDKVYRYHQNGRYQRPYNCVHKCINKKTRIRLQYLDETITMTTFDERGKETCTKHSSKVILPPGYYFSFTAFNDVMFERVIIHEFKVEEILDGKQCYDRERQEPWWNEDTDW